MTSDTLTRVNLKQPWIDAMREQNRLFLDSTDQLLESIESMVGGRLDQIEQRDIEAASWLAHANDVTQLPLSDDDLNRITAALLSRHPHSSLTHHLRAVGFAAKSHWEQAAEELRNAIAIAAPDSDLSVGLKCQLGAIALHTADMDEYQQICEEVLSAMATSLSPGIALRAARLLLTSDDSDMLKRSRAVLADLPIEALAADEKPWLAILVGQLATRAGEYEAASNSFQSAIDMLSNGAADNYARSSAFFYKFLADSHLNAPEVMKGDFWGGEFILTVQPFVRPDTTAKHPSWENWVYSVHANQATSDQRAAYRSKLDQTTKH